MTIVQIDRQMSRIFRCHPPALPLFILQTYYELVYSYQYQNQSEICPILGVVR